MYRLLIIAVLLIVGCGYNNEKWIVDTVKTEKTVKENLKLYPEKLDYTMIIYPNRNMLISEYKEITGKQVDNLLGFYSATNNTVYLTKYCTIEVMRHEIGHAVVQASFDTTPSREEHERMAKLAEQGDNSGKK